MQARRFDVILASDGATALDAAPNQEPDLLILDLNAGADDYVTKPFNMKSSAPA